MTKDEKERAWLDWARLALKHEGVQAAMEVLGAYLALNPEPEPTFVVRMPRANLLPEEF